jgi:FkbH-like protein
MVKLVIWDLDGVLWSGSITEGGDTSPNQDIIEFIKNTEKNGIIHSICSKNDHDRIKKKLQSLDIWELFVFPSINLLPKGNRINQIISDCQLRSDDVVFIDDNMINLNEATYYCPGIVTYNDPYKFIDEFAIPQNNTKTKQYRILETKKDIRKSYDSNIEFLKDSDINIAIAENHDCLLYQERVEELVNKSNQLNYTNSRFAKNTVSDYILRNDIKSYAVFAWDKYGYYGLIGYISIQTKGDSLLNAATITNFVFSCRVMNMNIEQRCMQLLKSKYKMLLGSNCIDHADIDYINVHEYSSLENFIRGQENLSVKEPSIAFLMHCLGPAYAAYSRYMDQIYYNIPLEDLFRTDKLYHSQYNFEKLPKIIVFASYIEFIFDYSMYWSLEKNHTKEYFDNVITHFVNRLSDTQRKALILLPKYSDVFKKDVRYDYLYHAWQKHINNPNLTIMYMPDEDNDDSTHPINRTPINDLPALRKYSRNTIHKIANQIDDWLARLEGLEPPTSTFVALHSDPLN